MISKEDDFYLSRPLPLSNSHNGYRPAQKIFEDRGPQRTYSAANAMRALCCLTDGQRRITHNSHVQRLTFPTNMIMMLR